MGYIRRNSINHLRFHSEGRLQFAYLFWKSIQTRKCQKKPTTNLTGFNEHPTKKNQGERRSSWALHVGVRPRRWRHKSLLIMICICSFSKWQTEQKKNKTPEIVYSKTDKCESLLPRARPECQYRFQQTRMIEWLDGWMDVQLWTPFEMTKWQTLNAKYAAEKCSFACREIALCHSVDQIRFDCKPVLTLAD